MANRSILCNTAMVLTFLATVPGTLAQSPERVKAADSISGITADRLTSKQLRIWREIEQIAEAADKDGQPLHPRLHSLWQWAKGNGHTITIVMAERRVPADVDMVGNITLGQGNSNGLRRAAILWLHPWAIDNAYVNPTVHRSDGLIRFYRLGKYERYAEVVGHELTHAFLMLENPEYARLCSEMHREAAEFLLSRQQSGKDAAHDEMTRQRQLRLQSMHDKVEKPAEAAELEIWRELRNGASASAGMECNGDDRSAITTSGPDPNAGASDAHPCNESNQTGQCDGPHSGGGILSGRRKS